MTATAVPTVKLFLDGKPVESTTSEWREVINPATQEVLARVPFATPEEVDRAVASAKAAFKTWKKTPIGARAHLPQVPATDPRKHEGAGGNSHRRTGQDPA